MNSYLVKCINDYKNEKSLKNLEKIRHALVGIINGDPSFFTDDFKKSIDFVLKQGITEVFEDNMNPDYPKISRDKSLYTKDYMAECTTYLQMNFCMERCNLIEAVGREAYKDVYKKRKDEEGKNNNLVSYQNRITKQDKSIGSRNQKSAGLSMKLKIGLIVTVLIAVGILIEKKLNN